MQIRGLRGGWWLAALLLCTTALPAPAATPLDDLSLSPDVTVDLAGTGVGDEDVAVDDLAGSVTLADLGVLPAGAAVSAYHRLAGGDRLFSLETASVLGGSLVVERGDVVRYDGVGYALELDGSAVGLPDGVAIDALGRNATGDLVLSFDVSVDLSGLAVDDEDLVDFDGVGFGLFFDGSAAGVPASLDLDAVHLLPGGTLGLSFDGSGSLGGVGFDDEDVLEYDAAGPTWSLLYDGSQAHAALAAADLDAVALPEPGGPVSFASGLALLVAIGRGRRRARAGC